MAKVCFSLVFAFLFVLYMGQSLVEASPAALDGESLYDSSKKSMPASCAGQNYCFDKGANYPDKDIDDLVYNMRELIVDYPELKYRFSDKDSYDEQDCAYKSTESPIFYIVDTNDKVRVVVQSPKKFQQIYNLKWCLNEGKITKDTPHFLKSTTLMKFSMQCVSTRMNVNFFVLSDNVDPKTQKPMIESVTVKGGIPVCCRCRYDAEH